MSALQGSKDKGEGWIHKVGVVLLAFGLLAFFAAGVAGIWFWLTTIIPFFWERGDYLPAVGAVALASLVAGAFMINNKESAN